MEGKGQLFILAEKVGYLGLRGKIAIIGIAEKLRKIYSQKDPIPLYLDKSPNR